MRSASLRLLTLLFLTGPCLTGQLAGQSFELLGPLTTPYSVSGDGRTVGGRVYTDTFQQRHAMVWNSGILTVLEEPTGAPGLISRVRHVSLDGRALYGYSSVDPEDDYDSPVYWPDSLGYQPVLLPKPDASIGCEEGSEGSISARHAADSLIVGSGTTCRDEDGIDSELITMWSDGSLSLVAEPPGGEFRGRMRVALDPVRLFGSGPDGPWVWMDGSFLDLTAPGQNPTVGDVSTDGTYVIGRADNGESWFRLTTDTTGQVLDELLLDLGPLNVSGSSTFAVSDDGELIAGGISLQDSTGSYTAAHIWTPQEGFRNLNQILEDLCVELDGWTLSEVYDMTPDGTVIIGEAKKIGEGFQGFRVELPRSLSGKKFADCACQVPDIDWTGAGTTGSFTDSDNWNDPDAPSDLDGAVFSLSGEQNVMLPFAYGLGQLTVTGTSVVNFDLGISSLDIAPPCVIQVPEHFTVGTGSGSNAELILRNGAVNVSGTPLIVGANGGTGLLRLTEAAEFSHTVGALETTTVGRFLEGKGKIIVQDEASFYTNELELAHSTGSEGTFLVEDAGSTFLAKSLEVGVVGKGDLSVESGGSAQIDQYMQLGQTASGVGTITVSGDKSLFGVSAPDAYFRIGGAGKGRIIVRDSATVSLLENQIRLASDGGEGHLLVSGEQSRIEGAGVTTVGSLGHGTLRIEDGGLMTTAQIVISEDEDQRIDSLSVTGQGSTLEVFFDDDSNVVRSFIGGAGKGIAEVRDGGQMIVQNNLGVGLQGSSNVASEGKLEVIGAGSKVVVERDLYIGVRKAPEGDPPVVDGRVLVGGGGTLKVGTVTYVGQDEFDTTDGQLEVIAGGSVETDILDVGPSGTIIVGGTASTLTTLFLTADAGASISGNVTVAPPSVPKTTAAEIPSGITTQQLFLQEGVGIDLDSLTVLGGTVGGTLTWPGTFDFDATLSPGDSTGKTGTMTIDGDYIQSESGILEIDVHGSGDREFDVLQVNGSLDAAGLIRFRFDPGYQPDLGERFDFAVAEEITSPFADYVVEPFGHVRLDVTYEGGTVTAQVVPAVSSEQTPEAVTGIALDPNYPEPFRTTTTLGIRHPDESIIDLAVFDLLGRRVQTLYSGKLPAGHHDILFDPGDLPSGLYFARLETNGRVLIETLSLSGR